MEVASAPIGPATLGFDGIPVWRAEGTAGRVARGAGRTSALRPKREERALMEFAEAARQCVEAMGPGVVRDSRRFVSCLLDYADDSLALRVTARNLDDVALAPFVEALDAGDTDSLGLASAKVEITLRTERGIEASIAHDIASAIGEALARGAGLRPRQEADARDNRARQAEPTLPPQEPVEPVSAPGAADDAGYYRFDRGFMHPSFADKGESGIVELINPAILVTDAVLSTPDDLWAFMGSPLLVIARDANEQTLHKLVSLNERGFPVWAVKAPGYGDRCREMLIDIATVTGGSIFSAIPGAEHSRNAFGRIAAGELGHAVVVRVSADSTCIYGGAGSESAISQRMETIRHEIEATSSDYDRERLIERFDALAGYMTGWPLNAGSVGHGTHASAVSSAGKARDGTIFGRVEIDDEEAAAGTKRRFEYAIPSTGETVCLSLSIPAGILDGQMLRLRRCGDYKGNSAERADLLILVNVKPSNSDTAGRGARISTASSVRGTSGPSHAAPNPGKQLDAFVAKVLGRVGQPSAVWVSKLGCYVLQSTARIGAWRMRTYFLIKRDDAATAADFDSFSRACASWVRSNKEFNNNMVAYPVLLQVHARHDVVAYAKQAPPGFLRDPGILTLPTVVDLWTGELHFMDASPLVGRLMWKGVRKAAVGALEVG